MDDLHFLDRTEAGTLLAAKVEDFAGRDDVVVCALPRGGVPVASVLAQHLGARLDIVVVRKLGVPGREELAMGALASGGVIVREEEVIDSLGIDAATFERVVARELEELHRRERTFRGDRLPPSLAGRTVIVVDDGVATGSTVRAAVQALRQQQPARIVVATPVASQPALQLLRQVADEVRTVLAPAELVSIGSWYYDFTQTTDDEVRELLERAAVAPPGG